MNMELRNIYLANKIKKNNEINKLSQNSLKQNLYKSYITKSTPNIFNDKRKDINFSKNIVIDSKNKSNKIHMKNLYLSNMINNKKMNYNSNYNLKKNVNDNNNIKILNNPNLYINNNIPFRNKNYIHKFLNTEEYEYNTSIINTSLKNIEKEKKEIKKYEPINNINKNNYIDNNNYIINNNYIDNNNSNNSLSDEDNSELSEIADKIVNSFHIGKNLNMAGPSNKNIKNQTKKIIIPKINKVNTNRNKNQRISPKNYTFKTVFVNNFCLLPMNSSFIDKSNRFKKINNKSPNYLNTDINSINRYKHSILFNDKKKINIHNSHSKNKDNKERENLKMNYISNVNSNKDLNPYFFNKDKHINKVKNKKISPCMKKNDNSIKITNIKDNNIKDNIFKENDFNEDYYYNTMDLSKLSFFTDKNNNNKNNQTVNTENVNNKHIKFDLKKNVYFFYNDKDYITKYKKYSENNINIVKNLKRYNAPTIRKFNKEDIKINKDYIYKENLEEEEITDCQNNDE